MSTPDVEEAVAAWQWWDEHPAYEDRAKRLVVAMGDLGEQLGLAGHEMHALVAAQRRGGLSPRGAIREAVRLRQREAT